MKTKTVVRAPEMAEHATPPVAAPTPAPPAVEPPAADPAPAVPAEQALPPMTAGPVVRTQLWGQPIFFTITNPRDHIQAEHRAGRFYEMEELDIIRAWFRPGSVFCDIGANIGNHSVFVLRLLHAARAILIEPNPAAIAVLQSNLAVNDVADRCDFSLLGIGLSDQAKDGMTVVAPRGNLGGGRMVEGGDLKILRGDDAMADKQIDFLKIDVEGMEMQVLGGLTETLKRCRPRIFIEVDRQNYGVFKEWLGTSGYGVRDRFRRYRANTNFMLVHPEEPLPPGFAGSR